MRSGRRCDLCDVHTGPACLLRGAQTRPWLGKGRGRWGEVAHPPGVVATCASPGQRCQHAGSLLHASSYPLVKQGLERGLPVGRVGGATSGADGAGTGSCGVSTASSARVRAPVGPRQVRQRQEVRLPVPPPTRMARSQRRNCVRRPAAPFPRPAWLLRPTRPAAWPHSPS